MHDSPLLVWWGGGSRGRQQSRRKESPIKNITEEEGLIAEGEKKEREKGGLDPGKLKGHRRGERDRKSVSDTDGNRVSVSALIRPSGREDEQCQRKDDLSPRR